MLNSFIAAGVCWGVSVWRSPVLTAGKKQSCLQKSWRIPIYATLEAGACLSLTQQVGKGFENENVNSLKCVD